MGRDKALVEYDGTPMAAAVASALRTAGCGPVVAIGGDPTLLQPLGLSIVADGWPGEGPLGGVLTALEAFAEVEAVVVVACDLPLLTAATVQAMVAELRASPAALAAVARTDRLQPLCVVWRPAASPLLRTEFGGGTRRLHDVLARMAIVEVSVHHQDLSNVNTPADLSK
jgi:molybdopterin-guanine dinucleotide biosynthesis protein A